MLGPHWNYESAESFPQYMPLPPIDINLQIGETCDLQGPPFVQLSRGDAPMEEIENHEETIKRICAEHFSRETQEAIEHLAIDLSCIHETVGTVATEVLRKAVESWKNVPLSNGESDMRTLIRYVNEAVQGREIKTLELKYLAKEIERIKRNP